MAYNLHYSDYATQTSGPPDPARWVGPQGEPGPPGPPGPVGPTGGVPEAPGDGTVYGRGNSPQVWTGVLPLTGGTVTGRISGRPDQSLGTGGSFQGYSVFSSAISGVRTGGDWQLSGIATTADTVDAGPGGLVGQYIHLISGGAGTSGNRVGQYIDTYFSGSTLDAVRGYPQQYAGQFVYSHASGNAGGTASVPKGQLWGGVSSATLQSGATYWGYCIGLEVNVGVSTGASAVYTQGLKIGVQNHNQAASPAADFLFGMGRVALSDQPFANGIMIGIFDGYWPITAAGTLIGTQPCGLPTPPPYAAAYGVDFNAVTFSQAAFRSTNFFVDGTGHVDANGIDFGSRYASSQADLTKHIALYGAAAGINITSDSSTNYVAAGAHMFWLGTTRLGYWNAGGVAIDNGLSVSSTLLAGGMITSYAAIQVGSSGPTWTTGSAAPAATAPVGSLYSRTGGAVGATLYVSRGSGTWAAVAGV